MNPVMDTILARKSVRAYDRRPIPPDVKDAILHAALRSPTAGNMMLYSIIDVTDQAIKDTLARTCDNQPFIATAPLVWLFVADYQRWVDVFVQSGVEALCAERGAVMRRPAEGDLLLHRRLFDLPAYTLPITLLCLGYPTAQQRRRTITSRFEREVIVFQDRYHRLAPEDVRRMFAGTKAPHPRKSEDGANPGQAVYLRKFSAGFSTEMTRSVRAWTRAWVSGSIDAAEPE